LEIHEGIRTLRSVRQFRDEPLPDDVLETILDAGRRAQSSKNTQPWQFVVVRDRETLIALSKTGDYAGHLAGAAAGIVIVSPIPHEYDLGQATAFLMLSAWELGVGSCIAAIYHPDQVKRHLGIPDEMHVHYALSFGYPADDWQPAKMGGRRTASEIVHWDRW
jgi:nitroreductase